MVAPAAWRSCIFAGSLRVAGRTRACASWPCCEHALTSARPRCPVAPTTRIRAISLLRGPGTRLSEGAVVRRRAVEGGHGRAVEPQVHRELPAVMRLVGEGIGDHHVTRTFPDHPSGDEEPPGGHQVLVSGRA